VPHRGATSGCHIGKKSSLLKMSQLDICVNSSVLHMHTDTPLGPRARPAAAEWAAGGDAASARKPQEQARIEARQGGLNHGAARGDMPPKGKRARVIRRPGNAAHIQQQQLRAGSRTRPISGQGLRDVCANFGPKGWAGGHGGATTRKLHALGSPWRPRNLEWRNLVSFYYPGADPYYSRVLIFYRLLS